MARCGLVCPCEDRRRYRLTRRGRARLDASARTIAGISARVEAFLELFARSGRNLEAGQPGCAASAEPALSGVAWQSAQTPSTVRTLSPTW